MRRECNYVGAAIVRLRTERGLTQEEVANEFERRGIKISRQVVANIECGRRGATDKQVYHFARLFGVSVESLYTRTLECMSALRRTPDGSAFLAFRR